jgi:hypothetical protein
LDAPTASAEALRESIGFVAGPLSGRLFQKKAMLRSSSTYLHGHRVFHALQLKHVRVAL